MNFDEDILQDFLVEAKEGITKLEEGFIELEKDPRRVEVLKELFRTMHSLKGAAGFFGFKTLESIAHFSEDILSKLRDGLIEPEEDVVDILLKAVDYIKYIISYIEENKTEPVEDKILDFLVELSNFNEKLRKKVQEKPKERIGEEKLEEKKEEAEKKVKEKIEEKKEVKLVEEVKEEKEAPLSPHVELAETHIKVDVKLLDQLMNLAGELVLARNRVVQLSQKIMDEELTRSVQILSMITTEMQETIMKTRMQPIGSIFNKFPRIVRDLAKALGKKVNLHLEGTETELDRSIIEAIKDPLTHLIRNAIDHGIETPEERVMLGKPEEGNLVLRAYQEGGQVVIEIDDDGRGIDIEKIKKKAVEKGFMSYEEVERASEKELLNLIFKPGFSTAETVTQLSGRGVGMDVVKANIEKLGGSIEINTIRGKGTNIKIKIPLTLAIIPALIVTSGDYRYAIPQVNLKELVNVDPDKNLLKVGNTEFYRLRGEIIPVLRLSEVLKVNGKSEEQRNLVILNTGERFIGLLVDRIFASEEIVVKPLGRWFKNIPIYSGATIMGDGKLALILDVVGLSQFVGISIEEIEKTYEGAGIKIKTSAQETIILLLFDVGEERFAIPIALISRLDKIKANEIKISGGKEIIIYRDEVVPIIRLENYLPLKEVPLQESYNVLFFTERGKTCGILCTNIVGTLETTPEIEEGIYTQSGILGHRIIEGKTTLFIDIYKIIEMYDPDWFIVKIEKEKVVKRILLAEDSPFFRGMIKNYLVGAGYEVETTENGKEALNRLFSGKFDLIITDLEMPEMDGFELIKEVRASPDYKNIPIIVVTSLAGEDVRRKVLDLGANAYEIKLNREKLLEEIERLLS
ncbi:CheA signal transduction histidine kinase [Thermodesulfobacterium geofontis OPF15]|uniref:histidine kinase n=1 Tax=Thermodesulfobacterium geofontis (strain OPF15) TaxID=795359 RepID=F8C4U8_THEGP|nr:chemotaxis protein CheW [Thermodesulfobacterium geofontis]AEH23548.1 CheA signal transduction histidine kinase [Thermodesulfobacterium geofontis OPF15]